MLPMTVRRRLDCVLDPTKPQVLETQKKWGGKAADPLLRKAARQSFYNTSKLDFERLKGDSNNIAPNLLKYIRSFSPNVRAIFEYFGFDDHVAKLDKPNRLFLIVSKFAAVDLHPEAVPNHSISTVTKSNSRPSHDRLSPPALNRRMSPKAVRGCPASSHSGAISSRESSLPPSASYSRRALLARGFPAAILFHPSISV